MNEEENKTPEEKSAENPAPKKEIHTEPETTPENIVDIGEAIENGKTVTAEDTIAELQQQLLEARDRTMRALADSENTRKRALKDRDDAGKYAVANFARDLLAFGDNFRRALESLPEDTPAAVSDGLNAMDKELLGVFTRHGVRKIEPLDEQFDANFHEVMFEAPMPGKEAGVIIQVIEPGYVLNDRLLRAAKVGIAKAADNQDSALDPGAQLDIEG